VASSCVDFFVILAHHIKISKMTGLAEIIKYIEKTREIGLSDKSIAQELSHVGWPKALVDQAMNQSQNKDFGIQPIISVKNLTKRYGDFIAVDSISFDVYPGEIFGILGPNGAGKTTTMKIMEGIRKPTSGTIILDGKDVLRETDAVKSMIGVQLQASTFFEGLTLCELLDTFASLYDKTVDAMELLREVQLDEKAKSQVKELSGGQKQRFSIAVGLVNNPKVLFLDEPTTGLDPQARRNLWDLATQIRKRGTTIIITTHYMDEAETLCDRIAIMDHAKIVALDTTDKLLDLIEVKEELVLKRATLEDVFLKLTGHQLRD